MYENGGAKQIEIDLPTKVVKIGSSLTIEWFQSFALDIDLDYFSASQLIVSLCQAGDVGKYLTWVGSHVCRERDPEILLDQVTYFR